MMSEKKPEDIDKYLSKFAIEGQRKLVSQLRAMLKSNRAEPAAGFSVRTDMFKIMDSFKPDMATLDNGYDRDKKVYLEILCRPSGISKVLEFESIEEALKKQADKSGRHQFIFLEAGGKSQLQRNKNRLFAFCSNPSHDEKTFHYWSFSLDTGIFYSRSITPETTEQRPDVFDAKIQSLTIGDALDSIGRFYYNLLCEANATLHLAFRYADATGLAVGNIGPDYFLPSQQYGQENLTLYIFRPLHEIIGRTAELTADIILELLKRLKYQGIVNRDFFIHAVTRHQTHG